MTVTEFTCLQGSTRFLRVGLAYICRTQTHALCVSVLLFLSESHFRVQSNALQSLSMPHHSLARATSRLFLDLCRHAHTVASRWFYVLARYPNADASNGFVLTAPSVMSNFMFVMHGRLPGAFIALPFLQVQYPCHGVVFLVYVLSVADLPTLVRLAYFRI